MFAIIGFDISFAPAQSYVITYACADSLSFGFQWKNFLNFLSKSKHFWMMLLRHPIHDGNSIGCYSNKTLSFLYAKNITIYVLYWPMHSDYSCVDCTRDRGSDNITDSKVHEAYMGPTWGGQDPGGPHVGPMNLVIRDSFPSSHLYGIGW